MQHMDTRHEYLVAISLDGAMREGTEQRVLAADAEEACALYREQVLWRNPQLQEWVLDKNPYAGFCGCAWFASMEEDDYYESTGQLLATSEQFRSRMLEFFADDRLLGIRFLNYYFADNADEDSNELPPEVFAYIAVHSSSYIDIEAVDLSGLPEYLKSAAP